MAGRIMKPLASSAFVSAVKEMPARTASFAGYHGPVALFGAATNPASQATPIAMKAFTKHGLASSTDNYLEVEWVDDMTASVKKPPNSTVFMPTINCGILQAAAGESAASVNDALRATSTILTEKGIVPVCFADSADALVPMVEGVRQITGEEFFMFHMGADTLLGSETAPMTQILRRGLTNNVLSVCNRAVPKFARRVRREHQVRYFDNLAFFSKGTFTVKDVRNQYPCFLVIDLGVVDPAFAPGVPNPEVGGITSRELIYLLSILRGSRLMGAVITGFDPTYDVARGPLPEDGVTALLAAKVIKETLVKVYSMSTLTSAEGNDAVKQLINQGKLPEKYPE